MQLSDRITKLAAELGIVGADALYAIAARVLLGEGNEVLFDGKGAGAVPCWQKFRVNLAGVKGGKMMGLYLSVPLVVLEPMTTVHDAVIKPSQNFAGLDGAEGITAQVGTDEVPGAIFGEGIGVLLGFGDGPGIESDPSYVTYATVTGGRKIFARVPTMIRLFLQIIAEPEGIEATYAQYQELTSGGVDIWLLLSRLPS